MLPRLDDYGWIGPEDLMTILGGLVETGGIDYGIGPMMGRIMGTVGAPSAGGFPGTGRIPTGGTVIQPPIFGGGGGGTWRPFVPPPTQYDARRTPRRRIGRSPIEETPTIGRKLR